MQLPLPAPTEQDFESLPPAIRRKFFSNVERLRIRLDQSDHGSPVGSTQGKQKQPNHERFYARVGRGHGPSLYARHNGSSSSISSAVSLHGRRGLEKRSSSSSARKPRKLRKPGSLHLAYLAVQADSQCFHSLPTKVQQQLFSREEQRRLRRAYRQSVILDAADQACYRRDHKRPPRRSADSETTHPDSLRSAVFWDSSDSEDDSPAPKMDQSLYDSFRWLDEDGDLDLSLDEYHAHVADAATKRRRHRLSFRRPLSISNNLIRKPLPSTTRAPSAPVSRSPPPLASLPPRHSTTVPPSHHRQISHAPRSSTSSIDPAAQYYQDPDARLKLRVYLASPQKFDEAIEFGFPALEQNDQQNNPDKEENAGPEHKTSSGTKSPPIAWHLGTFFEDNDEPTEVDKPAPSKVLMPVQEAPPQQSRSDSPSVLQRRQSLGQPSKPGPQRLPGNREMTLKMTLTRPDLRTASPTDSSSPSPKDDPLRLAELPPADRSLSIWDSDLDEQGVVKKMWRKLRRRA